MVRCRLSKIPKPPLFGVSQMGEVARQSRVGGGRKCPLSRLTPPTAYGRSRRGSDSPLDCHSLPRLRFAYPHPLRDRGALNTF